MKGNVAAIENIFMLVTNNVDFLFFLYIYDSSIVAIFR